MGEFFKGWQKKVGVVTLAMACVFVSGWVRSIRIADRFIFQNIFTLQYFESRSGRIGWSSSDHGSKLNLAWESFDPSSDIYHESYDPSDYEIWMQRYIAEKGLTLAAEFSSDWVVWRWRWAGFSYGVNKRQGLWTSRYCVVPYWSIVIPLTLTSAYLLLSNPRPSKKPESIPAIAESSQV